MFLHISSYKRNSALRMFAITLLIIFSFVLLSSESASLSNRSRHFSDYDQLIAIVESEKRLIQQQQQQPMMKSVRIDSDSRSSDDVNSTPIFSHTYKVDRRNGKTNFKYPSYAIFDDSKHITKKDNIHKEKNNAKNLVCSKILHLKGIRGGNVENNVTSNF